MASRLGGPVSQATAASFYRENPPIGTQKEVIRPLVAQKLVQGDTWYLIDESWMKKWRKYTGYDQWDISAGQSVYFPGPVDTSSLFSGILTCVGLELKEHLMEGLDYSLVPEKAWQHLVEWYGLLDGSRPIPRKVVEYGLYMRHCRVEVYLLQFKLSLSWKLSEHTLKRFSRANTVGDLEAALRSEYAIPHDTPCRVWHRYMSHTYELLNDPSQNLQDAGLYNMQTIVIEVQNKDGTWPKGGSANKSFPQETPTSVRLKSKAQCASAEETEMRPKDELSTPYESEKDRNGEQLPPDVSLEKVVGDDWLQTQQKRQYDELVQTLAQEQQKAIQASQRAQNALSRLESQVTSLVSQVQSQQERISKEERRASMAVQTMSQLQSEVQGLSESLETVEQERNTARERASQAEENVEQRDRRLSELERRNESSEERIRTLEAEVRDVQQQKQALTQELNASTQQLQDKEQLLQQAYQRADQEQQRATIAETRLQHSDQMFQDIFQRLIGQLPQSQPQWVVERNEIELTEDELGAGGWATVRVGMFRGNRVAAKCLHRQIVSAHNVRIFTREMNMAANARHPNLLQFIGATLDNQEPIILTELMPTSLRQVMEGGTRLSHPQITSVAHQVALALNYLHLTQPEAIIHRDVSSSNVLLEPLQASWRAKLSDYGSANFVRHTTTAGPGNPTYAAPEANNPEQQSTKMDVFSFGVLLVEMCAGELAPREHRERLLASIQWPQMVTQIRACLRHEPQRRPDMNFLITQMDQVSFVCC